MARVSLETAGRLGSDPPASPLRAFANQREEAVRESRERVAADGGEDADGASPVPAEVEEMLDFEGNCPSWWAAMFDMTVG